MTQGTEQLQMLGDLKGELGELRGQMRELIHAQNNMHQKLDSLSDRVAINHRLPDDVKDLQVRMSAAETKLNRTEGAWTFAKMLPAFIGGLIVWLATILTGKVGQ